jgi:4-hydroxy-tetrahydrodipicolinate synthase
MIVPLLSVGGAGVVSVIANILPRQTHDLVMAYHDGEVAKSREMQLMMLDYINALFIEVNPIPIKEAMNYAGIAVGGYRLPLSAMTAEHQAKLHAEQDKLFTKLGIKEIRF